MTIRSLAAAAKFGFMILLAQGLAAEAVEIKVLSGVAIGPAVRELGSQFERTTGHKLVMQFGSLGELKRQIDNGEIFDVVIVTPALIDDLAKQGKIAADTRANFARSGLGVGVRAGSPKPDVSSTDAFKRTLLNAESVAYAKEGAAGLYFVSLLDRLGIADDMKGKLKPTDGNPVKAVVSGEAEIVVANIPPILDEPGLELAAAIPSELQNYIAFTAALGSAAPSAEAGKALIGFLTSEGAVTVIKAKGMETPAR
jgi:molybdate transport system substrate-binding protein